jgi:L-ascorbate metabolism protein UlaG (beta-lactamase superfamily)
VAARTGAGPDDGEEVAEGGALRVTYVGHATLLLEVAGRRLLTDPNFDPFLGSFSVGSRLKRVSAPGVAIADLPQLDAILVTHAHADHLSFATLNALPPGIPIFAPPPIAEWLRRLGYPSAVAVAPGKAVEIEGLRISAAPALHQGSRYGVDRWRAAANMYLLDTGSVSCYFAGDTALDAKIEAYMRNWLAHRRLDVALLPIGYAPWWKFGFRRGHLTSEDALTLFELLQARYLIPYHWGTFHHVTSSAFDAIERFRALIGQHQRGKDVRILEPGETFDLTLQKE